MESRPIRIALPIVFVLLLVPSIASAADGPATAPATPKAVAKAWAHEAPNWSLDQMLAIYQANGDKETELAKTCARQALAEGKLQRAVREKWGKEAERAVARACSSDTEEDDDAATETINGDHAVIEFKKEANIVPLALVKVDGQWKIDVPTYVQQLGDGLETAERFVTASASVYSDCARDLAAGKYKSADELADHLDAELKKLDPGQ